jgi:hypothetical protein
VLCSLRCPRAQYLLPCTCFWTCPILDKLSSCPTVRATVQGLADAMEDLLVSLLESHFHFGELAPLRALSCPSALAPFQTSPDATTTPAPQGEPSSVAQGGAGGGSKSAHGGSEKEHGVALANVRTDGGTDFHETPVVSGAYCILSARLDVHGLRDVG